MLEVRCDCGKFLQYPDSQLGQMARCTKCKSMIRLTDKIRVHVPGRCLVCDEDGARPGYLKLAQRHLQRMIGGPNGPVPIFGEDAIFLRRFLCDPCYNRVNLTQMLRSGIILGSMLLSPLTCFCGLAISHSIELSMGPKPNVGSKLPLPIMMGSFLIPFVAFGLLGFYLPHLMKKVLGPYASGYYYSARCSAVVCCFLRDFRAALLRCW